MLIQTAQKLAAGANFPKLTVPKLGGGTLTLGEISTGYDWQMVVVYRGAHCPNCTKYLGELSGALSEFHDLGIEVIAVSGDPEAKALRQMEDVAPAFPVGYSLTLTQMQSLGLYISHPRSPEETDQPFSEPGLFIVNQDGKAQVIDISNTSFTRPPIAALLKGFAFIKEPSRAYPIRGTYPDPA